MIANIIDVRWNLQFKYFAVWKSRCNDDNGGQLVTLSTTGGATREPTGS